MNNAANTKATEPAARAIVEAAGQAGGIDEVRRLAEHGWPTNRKLDNDSPELRAAIRAVAAAEIGDDTAHGITFSEWLGAAGRSDSASEYDLRAAWRAGEDPAEYAV